MWTNLNFLFSLIQNSDAVVVNGQDAYVGGLEWVRVVDITTPSKPVMVAAYQTPSYSDALWVDHEATYVAAHDAGLLILGSSHQE